jgi:predicted ATPase/class 3 adenylate cyclase
MADLDLPEGTVTFLYTDLEGSTRQWERQPAAMRAAMARHLALLRAAVGAQRGRVFRTVGDGLCAAFATAPAALAAAVAGQRALLAEPRGGEGPLRARMALHTGAVEFREGDYVGTCLNRLGRLLAAAHGGQVVLSQTTADLVRDALPDGVGLRDLGEHRLRDLARPERVFQALHAELPSAFPALRALVAPPHNLPVQLTSFVGRERELAALGALLEQARLLTLTGIGGCGKTRLALQVAAHVVEAYPDGVWFVDLAPLADPGLVPQAVAAALGVREEPGLPLPATLTAALRPRRLLLVLDNCEHLVEACARLTDAVLRACPHLVVLATSREALGIAGETAWPVPVLPTPAAGAPPDPATLARYAAVRLFVERAAAVRPGFALTPDNAGAVATVCARLDGLPLALELAAARVRALSVDQLLARLEDRFRLLTSGSRTALARHQTLQGTVDWSHALLTAPERVLFRRLAGFAGGWTLEAAEAVCGHDGLAPDDILDLLTRLVDQSLVLADAAPEGPSRYRLLETLREYAQHKLVEAEEVAAVRTRHAAHHLALAEETAPTLYGHEQLAGLARLGREHANLLLALGWLADRAERGGPSESAAAEAALRLGAALSRFWLMRSHLALAREWLGRLLALPGAHGSAARARVLACAAEVANWRRDSPAARRLAREGLALARAAGDSEGAALSHLMMGTAAWQGQEAAVARSHLEASRRAFAALGLRSRAAQAVLVLANVAREVGDVPAAARQYAEAEALARRTGDGFTLGYILWNRAELARRGGDSPLARRLGEEALVLHRANRQPGWIGLTLTGLGQLALAEGDAETARQRLTQGLAVQRDGGYVWGVPWCLQELARVAEAQGQPARAARLWSAAAQHQALVGRPLPTDEGPTLALAVEGLRARLGDAAFDAAWATGRAMTLQQAVAYALEEARDST